MIELGLFFSGGFFFFGKNSVRFAPVVCMYVRLLASKWQIALGESVYARFRTEK